VSMRGLGGQLWVLAFSASAATSPSQASEWLRFPLRLGYYLGKLRIDLLERGSKDLASPLGYDIRSYNGHNGRSSILFATSITCCLSVGI